MENFYCVKDSTWCIDTGYTIMAVYKLNDNDVVMIDSGLSYRGGETKCVLQTLEENNLNVKAILATHGHLDHIGNNEVLAQKYGCRIYMYGAEAYGCQDLRSIRIQHSLVAFNELEDAARAMYSRVDGFIDRDAEYIEVCGMSFGIVHTPGHSISHIAIITPDNVAMVGDALMTKEEMEKTKIPYASNFVVDFESKRKLAELKYDKYIISHKGIRDNIDDEVEFNINYMKYRAEVILGYIEDGMCFDDIAATVINCMNIKISNRFYFFDIHGMIMPYVQYLEESGKITAEYENGYVRYYVTDNLD